MGLLDGAFSQSGAGGGILPPWLADTLAGLQQGGSPMLPGYAPPGFPAAQMPSAIDGLTPASALPAFQSLSGFLRGGPPGPSSTPPSMTPQYLAPQNVASANVPMEANGPWRDFAPALLDKTGVHAVMPAQTDAPWHDFAPASYVAQTGVNALVDKTAANAAWSWPPSQAELAQDAFRAAAETIGRRGRREAITQAAPLPSPPQYLESARYWGAPPSRSDASDQSPAQGSYLVPVPRAISAFTASAREDGRLRPYVLTRDGWEQVVPTATSWPVSPKLPSPTSWGDVATDIPPRDPGAPLTEGRPDDRRGILARMIEGAQGGTGGGELGISRENIQKYPALEMLQIPARMADTVPRVFGATIGGLAGVGAGLAEHFGMSPANADRLQRDLNVGGTVALLLAGAPIARQYARERADGALKTRVNAPAPRPGTVPEFIEPQAGRSPTDVYARASDLQSELGVVAPAAETPPFRANSLSAAARELPQLPEGAQHTGNGPHGPTIDGLQSRWHDALGWLRQAQTGEALGVLEHPEVAGPIDVIWGEHNPSTNKGRGLAHIEALHPEVLPDLPERLARMRVVDAQQAGMPGERLLLRSPDDRESAVVRTFFDGKKKNWLLTAFTPESDYRRGGGTTGSPSGSPGPTRSSGPPAAR